MKPKPDLIKRLNEIQIEYGITDRHLSKLVKLSPKALVRLKLSSTLTFNTIIYFTRRMLIPPAAWGLGIIETAMIKKGVDWKFLSVETGISVSALREIAGRINACDFRVKRSFLDKICIVLKLRRAHDFKYLYPEDAYAAKFGSETPEERKDRMKGAYITGKVGCWGSLSPKDRRVLIMKVEDGCSPAAKEPGFDIQEFIKRQADRMETGK